MGSRLFLYAYLHLVSNTHTLYLQEAENQDAHIERRPN